MFGEGEESQGVPKFSHIPPLGLLVPNANARDAALQLFQNSAEPPTFATMRREIAKVDHELLSIDRSFVQEIQILNTLAEQHVHKAVLEEALSYFPT